MEEDSKFEDSQDFLKFLFDQTPRTPELFIDLKNNDALNLPSISFEEEEELHTRRITEVYSAEMAASESKIASARIDDDKHQTLNRTLLVIEDHMETEVSKLQTETDSSPFFFVLDANSTDNSSSISFEKEDLYRRHQTEIYDEEIKAAKTKIDSPKIDKDKHHTLKFTLELCRGKKKADVSKLKTKADSDREKPVLHIESMPELGFIQQRNSERKAMHVRIQKTVFKSIASSKPQIKISNGTKKFETCNNKSKISSLLSRPNVVKFEISGEGWKKVPLTELQTDEMQISFSSKFQESLRNKTCNNSSSSDIFGQKWPAIKPKSPNETGQTLTKYLQTKSKEEQKFMPLKITKKRYQAEEISQLRKKSCLKAATSNSSNKLYKASLDEESKMNQDESSELLVMQSEAFQNVLPSDSSKMKDKNYKNKRSSLLKNKTCKNASSSSMCEKDCHVIKSLNLLIESCQTIEGSSQTKSKEDQMLILPKKRYLAGEILHVQKKLCHKAAEFELQNEMCETPFVEQLKFNQDQIPESLAMQNEDFQNVLPSDSSKMKDKNYKNARFSSLKNKTCKNASFLGICEKDCHVIKSLNLLNEPCQTIEGSPQTKSKEDQMLILPKKRYLAGEILQVQKKLRHKAAEFELQNEMCETPFVEQLKFNQDQIPESLAMQNEDFQNALSSDSSKMKDKNYKNARFSSLKNKTCKNASFLGICEKDCHVIKSLNLLNEPCQTIEGSPQTKSKEDQMLILPKKRYLAGEILQVQKKLRHKAAEFELQNEMCETPFVEQLKFNQDQIPESLAMQNEDFQNALSSDSSKMKDKNYKNARFSSLKNKTCKNASFLGICEKDCHVIKSLNLLNEPCQTIEGSPQTKSKEDQMLILPKKRYLAGEILQVQKKLCHKAVEFELQNEMCETPFVEQLKFNQDQIPESLAMQNEDFQNDLSSDSSKMKDKNYKNARFSSLKNKTCKNASFSGIFEKDCQVIKPLNPPNKPCQILKGFSETKSKEDQKLILAKKRYLTGEIPQLLKKLRHKVTTFEPKNNMRETSLDEQLNTTKDQISESLQNEGFVLSANPSKMQDENYKKAESPLLENKACKNRSSSSVCEKSCQAIKTSNSPDELRQTLKKSSQTKSKEEQSAMLFELIKKRHQTEKNSQLQKKLYQQTTTSKLQDKLHKISLTQRPEMNHDQISVMQTEDIKNIFPSDTSKMENENSKNAESLLLKKEICKNATSLGMHEIKLQAIKPPNIPNESYQTLEKSLETKSTEDQAIKPPNLTNELYQTLDKPPQTKTTGTEDQTIKPSNLPNESYQTLEKSPQTKGVEGQRGTSLKLANKRHREEEEVSQLQKKLRLKATTFEPQDKICKTSSTEQPHINQDQISESLIMQSEGFKNVLLSDSSGKVSEHGLSSAFHHERDQTTKQVLMKNMACQTEEEFLESHIKKDITTVFTNVQNEKIHIVKHPALNAKQNRKRSPKPDVLPNTNIMLSRCLLKKAPISEFIKQNCQVFADRKLQNKSLPTHSPTEIQTEEAETEIQPFIKNVKNRRNTPQLQSETSQVFKVLEPQNKQCLTEIASSSQNEMDQTTTSLELQNKFISQQFVLSSSTQNKNAQFVSSSELQEEKCEIIEQKDFSNEKIQEAVSNQVTVKQTSSEMINEMYLCKINCDVPASRCNTAYCTNISPLPALHGFVENINPPGNYRNICTGFIPSQVYNITRSAPAMLDHEVPHSTLIMSENHFDSYANHDNLERVNVNMNNHVIANQIACPIFFENNNITSFHNTDTSMLMHPYPYGSHEIFLNPDICHNTDTSILMHPYPYGSHEIFLNPDIFHNTDTSILMHPYPYGSHEIFLNPDIFHNTDTSILMHPYPYGSHEIFLNPDIFHNTDTSMLMHPYPYGSHEIVLNPTCTALINPSDLIYNYCHFGGLFLCKENCANVCLSCTNICNVCEPSASSIDLNESK